MITQRIVSRRRSVTGPTLILLLLLSGFAGTNAAQTSPAATGLALGMDKAAPVPANAEAPDLATRRELAARRVAELQDRIRAQEASQAVGKLPAGADAEQFDDHLQLLRQALRQYQSQADALARLLQLREARNDLDAETMQLPAEGPPYPVETVDGLWARVLATEAEIATTVNNQRIAESLHADARAALEQADQTLRLAREKAEKPGEGEDAERLRWQLTLAESRHLLAQASVTNQTANRQLLDASLSGQKQQLAGIRRQAEQAARNSPLTAADRDRMLAGIAERRARVREQLRKAAATLRASRDAVDQARDRLRAARERSPQDRLASDDELRRLEVLQKRLDAQKALADTATLRLDSLRPVEEGLALEERIWQARHALTHDENPQHLATARSLVRDNLERLALLKQQTLSGLNASYALVDGQRKYLAGLTEQSSEIHAAERVLNSYEQRIELLQDLIGHIESLDGLTRRWREEIELHSTARPWSDRLSTWLHDAGDALKAVWHYELFVAEDAIVVDGERIAGQRSITVSKLFTVLLVLSGGLWVTRRLARLLRWYLSRQRSLHVNSIILGYRLFYVGMLLLLVFLAMTVFKIPLTVFAFLGGALAIGLGFGAQNLINNFISGLILLVERPVRLGDIVELEGIRGRVASIGARYSEVRRFDGVDILIPNSALLENNVTNWTLSDRRLRLSVSLRVAYGAATTEVTDLIEQAVASHTKILRDPPALVLLEEFADSAMLFAVYFWVLLEADEDHRIVASDLRHRLARLFDEAGIAMALPQHDLHLHTARPLQIDLRAAPGRAKPDRTLWQDSA